MDLQSLTIRLRNLFASNKTEIEEYVESKNPKSAADVEQLLKQYTYNQKFMRGL